MKTKIYILSVMVTLFLPALGFCEIDDLVDYTFAKDGGTRCLTFLQAGKEIKCCINKSRFHGEIGAVYIGGYPGEQGSKKMNKQEITTLNKDIINFTDSKRYKAFKTKEFKRHAIDQEYRKNRAYQSIKSFQEKLSEKQ